MTTTLMDEEWDLLAAFLPEGWRALAAETGAMQRARGAIRSPDTLLQVLLLHVATGLSLKQATARAQAQGLATLSDVALLKRLRRAEGWLGALAQRLFATRPGGGVGPHAPPGRRLRAFDATTVREPGSTGTDWRIHYAIGLPGMRCDFYEVTDHTGGETFTRLPVERGDIILADRGYGHRAGVAHVRGQQGDVIVRINRTNFPLLAADEADDHAFVLLPHLRQLVGHTPGDWAVAFEADGVRWPARLCAIRKSLPATERAQAQLHRAAAKRQRTLQPETLEAAAYTCVLTTLATEVLDTAGVLELYRARWQIELCFKRLKSLFRLGHVPKRQDASAHAWIEGKLLTVLLIERLLHEARFFSPWGFPLVPTQPLARVSRGP